MNKLMKFFAALIIFIFVAGNMSAQSEEHPLLVNEKMAPVLKSLVDDGLIYNWGLFNHAWGDEWNVNVWYTVKDMDAFSKFWGEFRKRMVEKQPDAWKELTAMIMEHKDNIYSIQNQYPLPPQK